MSNSGDRGLAFLFGVLAAVLLVLDGVIDFVGGFVFLALGLGSHAFGEWDRSVVEVVVGVVVGFFTGIGRSGGNDRALAAGVILVVIAIVGWFGLGFASGVLVLLAALFALISGILYLLSTR